MKILNLSLMVEASQNGFTDAMRKVATGGYIQLQCGHPNFNIEAINMAEQLRPDLIFIQIQRPNVITQHTAKRLADIGFTINYSGDIRDYIDEWYADIGKVIQLTCFSNMDDVHTLNSVGIKSEFLQIGIDPQRYKNHGIKHKCEDIVFMGNNYSAGFFPLSTERIEMVDRMKREFGSNFGVYGNFDCASDNFTSNQIREAQQYNSAKISISLSHFNSSRYCSDRLLRAMASGIMTISHNFTDIEKDFNVGEHLDVYNNLDELVYKCKYYLDNTDVRNKIAFQGQQHILNNYTFDHMAENIVKLYKKYK